MPIPKVHKLAPALAAAIFIALLPVGLSATTVLRFDLPELVANSDYIGEVTVEKTRAVKRDGRIYTLVDLTTEDTWSSGDQPDSLTLELPGGRVGDITTRVAGIPHFEDGKRVVVFLNRSQKNDQQKRTYSLTGLSQGAFHLATGPDGVSTFVVPRLGDLNLIEVQQRQNNPNRQDIATVPASELHQKTYLLEEFKQAVMDEIHANRPEQGPETPTPEGPQ